MNPQHEQFVSLLTAHQSRLYAYVLSLVGDTHLAADVLQEANVVMWRKIDSFQVGTDFAAWAFHVAYLQVLASRQRSGRNRVVVSEDLLKNIAAESAASSADFDHRLEALDRCLAELRPEHYELLTRKYSEGRSLADLARELRSTPNSVGQMLHRLRQRLWTCIQRRLAAEAEA